MYTFEAYKALSDESGIMPGDRVRVVRKLKRGDPMWPTFQWSRDMSAAVGKTYRVIETDSDGDIVLDVGGKELPFPYFALSITKKGPPLIRIDGKVIIFRAGRIAVGCTEVPNDVVREIAKRLK